MASAYGDREDGGPLSAEDVIRSTVYNLRKAGHQIRSVRGYVLE